MNNPRTKRLKNIIIGQTIVCTIILLVAGYLIIYSLGYKINFSSRKIIKTGLVVLSINPKPDQILVNNNDMGSKDNVSLALEAGTYDIVVKKDGYSNWQATTSVESELVNYFKYIELFKQNPELKELADETKKAYLNSPLTFLIENAPKGLNYNDYEIWIEDKIVARYSEPISSVAWFPDYRHVVYQSGSKIEIIDDQGKNETVIANLESGQPAKYAIGSKHTEIYIYQNEKYYLAQIQ